MDHDTHTTNGPRHVEEADRPDPARRRRWLEGAVIVAFWSSVALLSVMREAFDPSFGEQVSLHKGEVLHEFLEYGLWAALTPLIFLIGRRFTLERRGWHRNVLLYVIVGVTVAVVIDLTDHVLWNALVPEAPQRPVSVRYVLSSLHFLGDFSLYCVVLIAGFGRAYLLRFQEEQQEAIRLRVDAAQLQAHLAEARLQALRMQINPHFLFNALHSISDGFENDAATARRMLARLSEILRYAFEGMDAQEVTLAEELRFLDGYLDIQRFRFEDRLNVSQKVAPDVREALVPNLILQPLVENAIKHGLSQLEEPGRIELRAWRECGILHLTVCDNGPGLTDSGAGATKRTPGIGLQNTRERLDALYGSNQSCMLEAAPGGGLMVRLSLPFHTDVEGKANAVDKE
jgi:signal transduction histidine kinase